MTSQTIAYVVWAALILAFGVMEGVTVQLVSIWFVLGSVAGLIAAISGAPVVAQVLICIGVSVISLVATRPLVKKRLTATRQSTNADRCIGNDAVVVEDINNLDAVGTVKADGKLWSARSSGGDIIPADSIVTVERIDGVKLIVSLKE
ncbi:MAG: NfeD family protein [Eubacteriales bacterium]|nr:NfeD family protein [Eubacteriales bacterium]